MVRAVVLALLAAGCGRFGFAATDPSSDGAVVRVDARPDSAPVCNGCTLAASEPDYATTQGAAGWTYGYWWVANDVDARYDASADFLEMIDVSGLWRPPDFDADMMSPNYTWCYIAAWGGHPGQSPAKVPVRRWTSNVAGAAIVTAHANKSDTSCGDGVHARVVIDGMERWSSSFEAMDAVGATIDIPVDLSVGSTVDFLLEARGDDACDTTTHSMVIHGP